MCRPLPIGIQRIDQAGITTAVAWYFTQAILPDVLRAADFPRCNGSLRRRSSYPSSLPRLMGRGRIGRRDKGQRRREFSGMSLIPTEWEPNDGSAILLRKADHAIQGCTPPLRRGNRCVGSWPSWVLV